MLSDVLYYIHSINIDKLLTNILFESLGDDNTQMDTELSQLIEKDTDVDLKHFKTILYYLVLLDHRKGLQENIRKVVYSSLGIFNIIKTIFPQDLVARDENIYVDTLNDDLSNSIMKYLTPELPMLDYLLSDVVNVDSVREIKRYMIRLRNIYRLKNVNGNAGPICSVCTSKLINWKTMDSKGKRVCHYCYYTCT